MDVVMINKSKNANCDDIMLSFMYHVINRGELLIRSNQAMVLGVLQVGEKIKSFNPLKLKKLKTI